MMEDLEEQILLTRIAKVDEDIELLRSEGENTRKIEVLNEYKRYLEDELQFLKNENKKA